MTLKVHFSIYLEITISVQESSGLLKKETNPEKFIFYFIYFQGEYKTSLTIMDTLKKPGNFISKILSRNSSKNSLNHQDCEIQKFNVDDIQVGFRHF